MKHRPRNFGNSYRGRNELPQSRACLSLLLVASTSLYKGNASWCGIDARLTFADKELPLFKNLLYQRQWLPSHIVSSARQFLLFLVLTGCLIDQLLACAAMCTMCCHVYHGSYSEPPRELVYPPCGQHSNLFAVFSSTVTNQAHPSVFALFSSMMDAQ